GITLVAPVGDQNAVEGTIIGAADPQIAGEGNPEAGLRCTRPRWDHGRELRAGVGGALQDFQWTPDGRGGWGGQRGPAGMFGFGAVARVGPLVGDAVQVLLLVVREHAGNPAPPGVIARDIL